MKYMFSHDFPMALQASGRVQASGPWAAGPKGQKNFQRIQGRKKTGGQDHGNREAPHVSVFFCFSVPEYVNILLLMYKNIFIPFDNLNSKTNSN